MKLQNTFTKEVFCLSFFTILSLVAICQNSNKDDYKKYVKKSSLGGLFLLESTEPLILESCKVTFSTNKQFPGTSNGKYVSMHVTPADNTFEISGNYTVRVVLSNGSKVEFTDAIKGKGTSHGFSISNYNPYDPHMCSYFGIPFKKTDNFSWLFTENIKEIIIQDANRRFVLPISVDESLLINKILKYIF